jgi:peptidoglycan/LPS O-acetylase OafA/YrhL
MSAPKVADAPAARWPTHETFRSTSYFVGLDVLRALAILAVIWHHTAGRSFSVDLSRQGFHGVTLFFAVSGFLIVTLLQREKSRTGDIALAPFMIKRGMRILPLYYVTLLVYIAAVILLARSSEARAAFFANLPAYATFTTNWFVDQDASRVIFYFAWSLAAEEQFYLLWPLIERAKLGRQFALTIALGIVALSSDFGGLMFAASDAQPFAVTLVSRIPAAIGLGVILAHMLHERSTFDLLSPILGRRGSALSLLTALILVLASGAPFGTMTRAVVDLLCVLLVGAVAIRPDSDLAVLSRVPGLVHIGVVSYGLYLMHMLAMNALKYWLSLTSGLALFAATTIIALAMASISHATFERAMVRLREQWLALLRTSAQPARSIHLPAA